MQSVYNAMDWADDCNLGKTRACALGYYAQIDYYEDALYILGACIACPKNSISIDNGARIAREAREAREAARSNLALGAPG